MKKYLKYGRDNRVSFTAILSCRLWRKGKWSLCSAEQSVFSSVTSREGSEDANHPLYPLSMADFSSVFLLLIVGLTIAILAFIVERSIIEWQRQSTQN